MHEAPIHRVEEPLPWYRHLLYSLQFLLVLSDIWLYPLLIAQAAGLRGPAMTGFLSMSLLCGAALTAAYAWKRLKVGLFLPSAGAAGLFAPLLFAAQTGGMAVATAMTVFAGLLQIACTPLIRSFKLVMRPVLAGLVMTMMAIWLASLGIHQLLGAEIGEVNLHGLLDEGLPPFDLLGTGIGIAVLLAMSIARLSRWRNWAILSGAVIGWGILGLLGKLNAAQLDYLHGVPWVGWPTLAFKGVAIQANLILPFILGAIYLVVTIFGKVGALQCAAEGTRYNTRVIRRANLISGLQVVLAGCVGAAPQTPKVAGIAMEQASGIFSRITGFYYAGALVVLAFCPKFVALLATIPGEINGAVLLLLSASAFSMGCSVMDFRNLPAAATKSFGIAAIFGVTAMIYHPLKEAFFPAALPGLMAAVVVFFVAEIFFFGLKGMKRES